MQTTRRFTGRWLYQVTAAHETAHCQRKKDQEQSSFRMVITSKIRKSTT